MNLPIAKKTQGFDAPFDLLKNREGIKPEIHYTFLKYFARVTQFLAWPIALVYFNLFFKLKISGQENFDKVTSPFIIISNHVAFYDSFVFRLILGAFTEKLPLRFMAVNSFRTWYLNLLSRFFITDIIYIIFGVFVVVRGRGIDRNLEEAVRIIKNGGSVVMYPEGSIMYGGEIENFKLGAASLAKKTGVPVVPISMRMDGTGFRREYIINVGESLSVDTSLSPTEITATFYDKIKQLHEKR